MGEVSGVQECQALQEPLINAAPDLEALEPASVDHLLEVAAVKWHAERRPHDPEVDGPQELYHVLNAVVIWSWLLVVPYLELLQDFLLVAVGVAVLVVGDADLDRDSSLLLLAPRFQDAAESAIADL